MSTTSIEEALRKRPDLPKPLRAVHVELDTDWSGDAAVWVWVILDDDDLDRETRHEYRSIVRETVADTLAGARRFVYVRFRGVSEPRPA